MMSETGFGIIQRECVRMCRYVCTCVLTLEAGEGTFFQLGYMFEIFHNNNFI